MSGDERCLQILEIAGKLFSEKGFNGTTTKEIAVHADISEAIIFRHFPSKEALFLAILEHKTQLVAERIKSCLDRAIHSRNDEEFFRDFAATLLEQFRTDQTLFRLVMFSALEKRDLSDIYFETITQDTRGDVRKFIRERIAEGSYRKVDPVVAEWAFTGMVIFHVLMPVIFSKGSLAISTKKLSENIANLFLDGIRKKTRRSTSSKARRVQ
jgi:AcrR family transcriptional regulator